MFTCIKDACTKWFNWKKAPIQVVLIMCKVKYTKGIRHDLVPWLEQNSFNILIRGHQKNSTLLSYDIWYMRKYADYQGSDEHKSYTFVMEQSISHFVAATIL
jgi:hypothetical protein